jgi:hypothetical protein
MFKVIVLVVLMGTPIQLSSKQSFDTKEACEAFRPASIERLKVDLKAQDPEATVEDSACEKVDE